VLSAADFLLWHIRNSRQCSAMDETGDQEDDFGSIRATIGVGFGTLLEFFVSGLLMTTKTCLNRSMSIMFVTVKGISLLSSVRNHFK